MSSSKLNIPFETPEYMSEWTDEQKAEFIFQLMKTLSPSHVVQIIDRIAPHLGRDFISQLPYEISLQALGYLDLPSLIQASKVCKTWQALCSEQTVWRSLFEKQGWSYDQAEIDAYLSNTPIVLPVSAVNPLRLSSIAINRTSPHKPIRLNRLMQRQLPPRDELTYHYNLMTNTRFINWKRLYVNRQEIEKRWIRGEFSKSEFPSSALSRSELHSQEGVYCIQFDKDKYVTGSRDNTIKVWDSRGRCTRTIQGHMGSVLCLQYHGHVVVSGSSDSNLVVSDLVLGENIRTLTGHQDSVLCLKLVGKDKVISCSKDGSMKLWNMDTGDCIRTYNGHEAAVNTAQWEGNIIVSGSGDRTVRVWDMETGKCLKMIVGHTRGVACVEYDGHRRIFSGSSDRTIKVWDMETGLCIYTLVGHTHLVRTIQLDRAANRLVSGCYNGSVKVWDLNKGSLIHDFSEVTNGRILNLKFDFSKVVCCSNSYRLDILNFALDTKTNFLM